MCGWDERRRVKVASVVEYLLYGRCCYIPYSYTVSIVGSFTISFIFSARTAAELRYHQTGLMLIQKQTRQFFSRQSFLFRSFPLFSILTRRTMSSSSLPSTLTGPPVSALVPPEMCQFGPDFTSVPLQEIFKVSDTSSVFRFALPDTTKPLNLSTCACVLAQAVGIDGGEAVVRPYTPISTNANVGYFDLLIKNYGPPAKMSPHIHAMKTGDTLNFKHIPFNVKIQPEEFMQYDEILMLVGGTGITPMIQALHAMLGSTDHQFPKKPVVTMLYGSKVSNDILGNEVLAHWAKEYPKYFQLTHVLSHEPEDSKWNDGVRGFITKELIADKFPFPAKDASKKTMIFVCGPPPMYNALCGPRDEKDKITGVLGDMGYQPSQVYKF